ncbi:MAG: uracil-DNA glycosylase family protein [Polaromonas sp.]
MMQMDKRQRAMLKEMGVRVWQPMPQAEVKTPEVKTAAPAAPENAIDSGAARARIHSPTAPFNTQKQPVQAIPAPAQAQNTAPAWQVGTAQTLYAGTAVQTAARWLVLLEAPASALQDNFNPLDGDAGKLLDNMLRAAGLHTAAAVLLAPLVRSGTGGDLPSALAELLVSAKADVVLVMGRLAAQALLQSTEPLAKLRGQVHAVQGQQVVITIDPTYLLRNPQDKAKAWDDLCLALSVFRQVSTP